MAAVPTLSPASGAGDNPNESASALDDLPLPHRLWRLYCQGLSYCAIARELHLERHFVARHVRATQRALAQEHSADLLLARDRAVDAAFQLLAQAWDDLETESHREDIAWRDLERAYAVFAASGEPTSASPLPATGSGAHLPTAPRYRAQRARLLGVALRALSQAVKLQGLDAPTAGASNPPAPEQAGGSFHASNTTPASRDVRPARQAVPPSAQNTARAEPAQETTGTIWNMPFRAENVVSDIGLNTPAPRAHRSSGTNWHISSSVSEEPPPSQHVDAHLANAHPTIAHEPAEDDKPQPPSVTASGGRPLAHRGNLPTLTRSTPPPSPSGPVVGAHRSAPEGRGVRTSSRPSRKRGRARGVTFLPTRTASPSAGA